MQQRSAASTLPKSTAHAVQLHGAQAAHGVCCLWPTLHSNTLLLHNYRSGYCGATSASHRCMRLCMCCGSAAHSTAAVASTPNNTALHSPELARIAARHSAGRPQRTQTPSRRRPCCGSLAPCQAARWQSLGPSHAAPEPAAAI
jgi:hypothetical protein